MSVIADLLVPADAIEIGRILDLGEDVRVVLETMVPLGDRAVPMFWVHGDVRDRFEERTREHPSVDTVSEIESHDGKVLYAIDWRSSTDPIFQGIRDADAQLLNATGTADVWEFELRFPNHQSLSGFREHCADVGVALEVRRIYNPTRPDSGPWYGLSSPQREALVKAVEEGYYSIPRKRSTKELAEDLGISDQAVTERLRRAIITLVENTLVAQDAFENREAGADARATGPTSGDG